MATVSWPADLPQRPLLAGYEEQMPDELVRTQMDAGPDKVRRRFTSGVRVFTMEMILDDSQAATFDTFFNTDLEGGVKRFDWTHPRTGNSVEFRFRDTPSLTTQSDKFRVTMTLEILP